MRGGVNMAYKRIMIIGCKVHADIIQCTDMTCQSFVVYDDVTTTLITIPDIEEVNS